MMLKMVGWGLIAAVVSGLYAVPVGRIPAQGPPRPSPTSQLRTTALSWTDSSGRPSLDAREALSLLTGADQQGLDPADYQAAAIEALLSALDTCPEPLAADIACSIRRSPTTCCDICTTFASAASSRGRLAFGLPDRRAIATSPRSWPRRCPRIASPPPQRNWRPGSSFIAICAASWCATERWPPTVVAACRGAVHPGDDTPAFPNSIACWWRSATCPRCARPVRRACLWRGDRRRRQALSSAARPEPDGVLGPDPDGDQRAPGVAGSAD